MKTEPPRDTDPKQDSREALISTLLVTVVVACTVFGAALLATQSKAKPDQPTVDLIPTAALATPPPITIFPTIPIVNQNAPANKASPTIMAESTQTPTERSDEPVATPSPPAEVPATPTLFRTIAPKPSATALRCASNPPTHWQPFTVRPGETLYTLAIRHETTMEIVSYNNCLKSYQLQAGQQLYLPPLKAPVPSATVAVTATPSPAPTQGSPPPPQPTLTAILTLTAPPTLPTATASATTQPTVAPTMTPTARLAPTEPSTPTLEPTATAPPAPPPSATPAASPTSEPTNTPPPGILSAHAPSQPPAP